MKILVLTSRYTALRDIIEEDFGRQTRLFEALSKYDNEIHFYCVDYRKKENKDTKLHDMKIMIRPFSPFNPLQLLLFYRQLKKTIKEGGYDLIIGTSDPLWGVFGYYASKSCKIPFLYDLHDNYEVYQSYSIPFMKYLDRHIIKKSYLVTTVSHTLKEYIAKWRKENVFVVQNGVDFNLFKPENKIKAREILKLPKDANVIAYAGSIQKLQGIDILIEAFIKLKNQYPKLLLFLAGRIKSEKGKSINMDVEGLIHVDHLDQQGVVNVINAADIAVIPNRMNAFTKYCFPYKCVEYMACNTPIVATNVGDVADMLKAFPNTLCNPDDVEDMTKKISFQLNNPKKSDYRSKIKENTWMSIARDLDKKIRMYLSKKNFSSQ
ncbi:MAG: glycosyltransferase family 4 protein [Candidatus Woesearchaeota archaeon]|jgi:glycosyltransferase involved in cell wall biosynthesis|nr:glycosyltransferase family 4 protein [Candidatus Woesearchaeota archaeon]MDP7323905.1 glycosyltransferase family 4 protein [Candidatus Woesearchaeota archaeon]MDP7457743.1 glycosyltransferase family 4 protein [Candidatus Woesearchaeota archaeon]